MDGDLKAYDEMLCFLRDNGHERHYRSGLTLLKAYAKLLTESIEIAEVRDGR